MKQPILEILEPFPSTLFKHQLTVLDQIHFHKYSNISCFISIPRPLQLFWLYLIFHSVNGSRNSNFQKTCNLSLFSICAKESNKKYWDKRWRSPSSEKWCHGNTSS